MEDHAMCKICFAPPAMRTMEDHAMCKLRVLMLTLAVLGLAASAALAQRGVGDPAGVARSGVKLEIVTLSGKVLEVKTEPCANTTGRSPLGTHFLMKTAEGKTLNIHLGPAAMVEFAAKELVQDKAVKVQAFRTEKMKEEHYVAQTLSYDGRSVTLRDETLQPVWAGGAGTGRVGDATVLEPGRGVGPGWGRGLGYGRNRAGGGQGAGFGRGAGYGWRGWQTSQGTAGSSGSQN
jgi:hypothetical protein